MKMIHRFMKTILLLSGSLLVLTGCSTARSGSPKHDPETVLVTYRVKAGKEAEFRNVLSRAWDAYRRDGLVFAEPHVVVQDTEDGKPRFVRFLHGSAVRFPSTHPIV